MTGCCVTRFSGFLVPRHSSILIHIRPSSMSTFTTAQVLLPRYNPYCRDTNSVWTLVSGTSARIFQLSVAVLVLERCALLEGGSNFLYNEAAITKLTAALPTDQGVDVASRSLEPNCRPYPGRTISRRNSCVDHVQLQLSGAGSAR